MKRKSIVLLLALVLSLGTAGFLFGCNSDDNKSDSSEPTQQSGSGASNTDAPAGDVNMSYISIEDAKAALDANDDSYVFVDVRKAEDYSAAHIPTSISADMDAAKDGDTESGKEALTTALTSATGDSVGADKKLVLICYSGKAYAQATTNILSDMGATMGNVFTLEGGMTAWSEAYPEDVE